VGELEAAQYEGRPERLAAHYQLLRIFDASDVDADGHPRGWPAGPTHCVRGAMNFKDGYGTSRTW
jgi:hypothetical protein